jgi:hypothetical protein
MVLAPTEVPNAFATSLAPAAEISSSQQAVMYGLLNLDGPDAAAKLLQDNMVHNSRTQ